MKGPQLLFCLCLVPVCPAIYIRYTGCKGYVTAPESHHLEDNSPERCFQTCHPATQMVALHGDDCVCDDDFISLNTFYPRSIFPCDGEQHVMCGCVDARRKNKHRAGWSIYEKTDIVTTKDKDVGGCVAASYNGTAIHLVTTPCDTTLTPLCSDSLAPTPGCTKGVETIWSESCNEISLGYLPVNQYNSLTPCDISSDLFWTGFLHIDDTAPSTTTTTTKTKATTTATTTTTITATPTQSTTTTWSTSTSARTESTLPTSKLPTEPKTTSPAIRTTHRISKTNNSMPRKRPSFSNSSTPLRHRPIEHKQLYGGDKNRAEKNLNGDGIGGTRTSSTTSVSHPDVSTTTAIFSVEVAANTLQEDLKRYVIGVAVLVVVVVGLIVGTVFCIAMRKQRKMLKSLSVQPSTLASLQQDSKTQGQEMADEVSSESDLDTNVFTIPCPSFPDQHHPLSRRTQDPTPVFTAAVRHDTSAYNDVTSNLDQSRHADYSSPYRPYSNRYLGIYSSRGFQRGIENHHQDQRRQQYENSEYMLRHERRHHVTCEEEPDWVTLMNRNRRSAGHSRIYK